MYIQSDSNAGMTTYLHTHGVGQLVASMSGIWILVTGRREKDLVCELNEYLKSFQTVLMWINSHQLP